MKDIKSLLQSRPEAQGYSLVGGKKSSSSKPGRRFSVVIILCIAVAVTLILTLWYLSSVIPLRTSFHEHYGNAIGSTKPARLHLLIPATSSNQNLCKLFLSVFALGYPVPIIINWQAPEAPDKFIQHLAKVQGIADYLDKLQETEDHENDLVVVVDGYDLWFQLGPDVLLKRYFDTIKLLDSQVRDNFGAELALEQDMRHTVLFGADKACWPAESNRTACWAMPDAEMPEYAYGPHTQDGLIHETDYSFPRWLNSGTVMGPIADVHRVMNATLKDIRDNFTRPSDQLYFANVMGAQEEARLSQRPGLWQAKHNASLMTRQEHSLAAASPKELHIGLDHRSSLFQTGGLYKQFLMWAVPSYNGVSSQASEEERKLQAFYHQAVPSDVQQSKPPFGLLDDPTLAEMEWKDVSLLHNTITRTIPVIIHFTSAKLLREWWWAKTWFQPHGDALRRARMAKGARRARMSDTPINGGMWYGADAAGSTAGGGVAGAGVWSDKGEWITWESSCSEHEHALYD